MQWLVVTCLVLWARHGEGGGPETPDPGPLETECLAGSEWESNCHFCRCSVEGLAECSKQALCDAPNTVEPIRCKPNTTFQRDCNKCACLDNGMGLCTLKICERTAASIPSKESLPKGIDCSPGSSWRSQCNDCVCSPKGLRFCTEKACPGEESEPLLRCAPHSLWKKNCNTCWCTSDGHAMCTRIGCVGIPSDLHFSDEEKSAEREDPSELEQLTKVPEAHSNKLPESNVYDRNDIFIQNIKANYAPETNLVAENPTSVILKELDVIDHNDFDASVEKNTDNIDEKSVETYSKSDYSKKVNKDSSEFTETDEQKEMISYDLKEIETPYMNQELEKYKVKDEKNIKRLIKDVEVLDTPSTDQKHHENFDFSSRFHHVRKRSVCKPNQDFKNECNTCKCSATGQSYDCTQNECMDKDKEDLDKEVEVFMETEGVDHIERHSVCKPRSTFFVGCNPCHCNADGTDFSCTNKPCPLPVDVEVFHELNAIKSAPKPSSTKKVCVENRMFIMNCNTCWCNEDGTSYFCTRKACVPELPEEPSVEEGKPEKLRIIKRACRPDEVFELECNMCRCNGDGTSYYCTRKACEPELPGEGGMSEELRIKRECRPGEVFALDCNMCRCSADGKSFSCTRRACIDDDSKKETQSRKIRAAPQEPPKSCQPGQEFRMDCNKCLCDNEGQDFSCTRIDCTAINNNNGGTRRKREVSKKVSTDCVAGSVFNQGCNVCRCTEDGGHAVCTLNRCALTKHNATATATESSFRCNPGEQFKQNCNDCSCSADGKSVYCTLRICDDELAP